MNVLTPVFNPDFIRWIRGLCVIYFVIYKFTKTVYSYFKEKEMQNTE